MTSHGWISWRSRAWLALAVPALGIGCGDEGSGGSEQAPQPPGPCQGYSLPPDQHFVADGLCVGVLASDQGKLRQIAFAPNGDLFGALTSGEIRRYRDVNRNGVYDPGAPEIVDWANTGGDNGNNVHIDTQAGYIYAGSQAGVKRWRYTADLDSGGAGEDVMVGQPSDGTHKLHPVHVYDGVMYVSSGSSNNLVPPVDPTALASADYDTERSVIKRFDLSRFTPGTPLTWGSGEVFARGLRNVVGFTRDAAGRLYGVMNGIDSLRYRGQDVSNDNPGDTLVLLEQGKGYGYPYCFSANFIMAADGMMIPPGTQLRAEPGGSTSFVSPASRDDAWCSANATPPVTTFQAHAAPLDVAVAQGPLAGLPAAFQRGAFVSLHGSWNRESSVGHHVVFVPFDQNGRPTMPTATTAGVAFPHQVVFGGGQPGMFRDGVWGWKDGERKESRVRPVGVAISPVDGALYVSSDNATIGDMLSLASPSGAIYRISGR